MEQIEITCKPFYFKIKKTPYHIFKKFTKSRPKQEKDFDLYKFTKYHEIILTKDERKALIEKHKCDRELFSMQKLYEEVICSDEYNKTVFDYRLMYVDDYFGPVSTHKVGNEKFWTIKISDHIYVIDLKDGKHITDYSNSELKEREIKREQESEYSMISNVLKQSIDSILEKYGMVLNKEKGIQFKNVKEYYNFIKLSLNNVIDELDKNGYSAKINPRVRSIKYLSVIVNKNDLRLKK